MKIRPASLLFAFILIGTISAHAQSFWDGSESADWNNPANWTNGYPANVDAFVNPNAGAFPDPTISANATTVNDIRINDTGTGTATVNQTAGTIRQNAWFRIAPVAGGTGVFNMSGGTHTVGGARVHIGENGIGIMDISGGTFNATGGEGFLLADQPSATGTVNQTGGTVTKTGGWFSIGGSGTGEYNLSGGTLSAANDFNVADVGTSVGTLNVSGTGVATSTGILLIGKNAGTQGFVNLDGGAIEANRISSGAGAGTSTFNFNGGALRARQNNALFFQGITNTFVKAGGAIIDSQAFNVTIAQNLQTDAISLGGGLTKLGTGTLELTGVNTYTGPTTLSAGTLSVPVVDNGGAPSTLGASSNAAANLIFNGGALRFTGASGTMDRNFTINPGQIAIIDVPTTGSTLTLTGGAAATAQGLTKTGAGTLALNGTNLYTGATTINGGVLAATGAPGSGFVVNNGGHLTAVNQAISTLTVPTLTLNAGSAVDFEFGAGNDLITIANPSGLTLGTTGLFLYQVGSTTPFATNGTYTLFDYNTAFNGTLTGAFSIANSQVGKVYGLTNNAAATRIELTIADAQSTQWTNAVGNNLWTTAGNWNNGIPNSIGAVATFGLLATPTAVAVNGPKTVGSIVFNNPASYSLNGGAPDTITLNNGFGTPSVSIVAGSHTITAPLVLSSNTNFNAAAGTALTVSGNISGPSSLTLLGGGTMTLSGTNAYTGETTIVAGTLAFTSSAAAGGSSSIIERSGAVLRLGSGTFTQPVTFDLAGGLATEVSGTENGTANFTIDVPSSAAATIVGAVSNVSGSFVKTGGGSLAFTNPGTTQLSNVAGLSTVVQNGSVILNGGASAVYSVTSGELAIGDNTPNQVSLTLASGTLNVGTFTSVGRGNGTTGLQSTLNITGGTLNTLNLFSGFDNGVGGYNAAPAINVSGAGAVNVTTVRLGESLGSNATLNLSGSAILAATGDFQIGFGGTAIVTVADNATLRIPQLALGRGNDSGGNPSVGILRQTGGTVERVGAFGGDWRIGGYEPNDSQAYGSYSISGGTLTTDRNFQIGAFGQGVLEISGTGNVSSTGDFPVVGRFSGGLGLLNIRGGSFNQTTPGTLFIIGEAGTGVVNVSGTGALNVAANPGPIVSGGGTGGLRIGHIGGGLGELNINGGTVRASGLAKSDPGALAYLYLNGGTVLPTQSNMTFLQGLDSAVVGPGGAIFDTNGNDVTIAQALLAPVDNSVTAITLDSGGSGYLDQPIVRISGDGTGATAVATVSGGMVTGISITNPGSGYNTIFQVEVLGGGGTGAAATATLGAAVATGGLTKNGVGALTLTGTNTYGGSTIVNAGTLNFGVDETLSGLNIASGATVVILPDSGFGLVPVAPVPEPGVAGLLAAGALGFLARRRRSQVPATPDR